MRYFFQSNENIESELPQKKTLPEKSFKEKYFCCLGFSRLKKLPKIMKKWEKITLAISLFLFLSSGIFLLNSLYRQNTNLAAAYGGKYVEGSLGQPRYINPLYASTNDADRDLVELIFSGLVKYNADGEIIPDLAEKYEIKDNGKTYEFTLKEGIVWHDGKNFSTNDVAFTIKTIQNSDYKSPLRANWLGVDVEVVSAQIIRLKIKTPYNSFLENCTVKILPEHIWGAMPAENFPLALYNLQPVGTGPFKFKSLKKDNIGNVKMFSLEENARYFDKKPYLSEITFEYFTNQKNALNALKKGEIQGIDFFIAQELSKVKNKPLDIYEISMPRYFALFFNPQKATIFQDANVRKAINYAINRPDIIEKILLGHGKEVQSPILPDIFGFNQPTETYNYDVQQSIILLEKSKYTVINNDGFREKLLKKATTTQFKSTLKNGSTGSEVKLLQQCLAIEVPDVFGADRDTGTFGKETEAAVIKFQEKYTKDILEPSGLKEGTGEVSKNTRAKLNEVCPKAQDEMQSLEFSISTINQPEMIAVANYIKDALAKDLGIKVNIQLYDNPQLEKDIIKPRNYEALLFGEVLNLTPDLFSFWHSSQKKDPGLNLANYENKKVDKLLEEIRQTTDESARKEKYENLQNMIIADAPVVFLYAPEYLYPVYDEVKGINIKTIIDPSKRFSDITNWYTETKRVWK